MVDVVITYELPQRELENAMLLKSYLTLCGYSCDIVKFPFENHRALRKKYFNKVKCVIVESLYDETVVYDLVYSAFGKVKYILNSQCEQIRSNRFEKDPNSYSNPKGIAKKAYHLCWGERIAELLQASGVSRDKTVVVGPVQMDFLRKQFQNYYIDASTIKKKYGIDETKKVALFISSFSFANLTLSGKKTSEIKLGKEFVDYLSSVSKESQEKICEWFDTFLSSHEDFIIIYRNESFCFYYNITKFASIYKFLCYITISY